MIKSGDVVRWKQPTVGTVVEVNETTAYFVVQFEGQNGTWSFGLDELQEFDLIWPIQSRGRHAKPDAS
jgi:hypothetical protein